MRLQSLGRWGCSRLVAVAWYSLFSPPAYYMWYRAVVPSTQLKRCLRIAMAILLSVLKQATGGKQTKTCTKVSSIVIWRTMLKYLWSLLGTSECRMVCVAISLQCVCSRLWCVGVCSKSFRADPTQNAWTHQQVFPSGADLGDCKKHCNNAWNHEQVIASEV